MDRQQLHIHNSLTRKKEVFASSDDRIINWYCCGPTVYDASHLGHARCYMTFDIIRRILTGYFGYRVRYVMNVTDIDDKIIKRTRTNHLCDKFIEKFMIDLKGNSSANDNQALVNPVKEALENYKKRNAGEQDKDKLVMIKNVIESSEIALQELMQELANEAKVEKVLALLERLRDPIGEDQDALFGHTVTDLQLFKNHALKFEQDFQEDMQRLDVMPPLFLTRVSEYIDEIGEYIVKLEKNGFAYRSDGSIYFDTEKFDADPKHSYAKLVREHYIQKTDHNDTGLGKKSPNDFALWKKSKSGEPSWQTQDFEPGRPGWHIECSAMASKLFGENFDIHSGGHDLKFPHHDNEIAQAEAYYNTGKSWVNYFLHSGHLTISGCKMSKSLKNFVPIKQALNEHSSRQLRFAFLAHKWDGNLDYSPNTMKTALNYEKTFREFFLNVSVALRNQSVIKKPSSEDCKLDDEFTSAIKNVEAALCDNFDTRTTLNVLCALVKECNKRWDSNSTLIGEIATYIEHILSIFGAHFDELRLENASLKYVEAMAQFRADVKTKCRGPDPQQTILGLCDNLRDLTLPELGVRLEDCESGDCPYVVQFIGKEQASGNCEASLKYVEALAKFRADIKTKCTGTDPKQSIREIFGLCDGLRDLVLPELGVRLEDRQSGDRPYDVKFVDPEVLAREREEAKQSVARRKKK